MLIDYDPRIRARIPFLKNRTVMYIDGQIGMTDLYLNGTWTDLRERFEKVGFKFIFLPEISHRVSPALLWYIFPDADHLFNDYDLNRRIQELAGLKGQSGFLYRAAGATRFHALPHYHDEALDRAVYQFISGLNSELNISKVPAPRVKRAAISEAKPRPQLTAKISEKVTDFSAELFDKHIGAGRQSEDSRIRFSKSYSYIPEEPLDPRVQAILDEIEKLERDLGVTISDLERYLGAKASPTRIFITRNGRILLQDLVGSPEVEMDDLTKALYFFYLHHPEGVAKKEVNFYEAEVLKYYSAITRRDDPGAIQRSVHILVDPFSATFDSCLSRIKSAFTKILGEHIAKNYYVDGRAGQKRKVRLDQDKINWQY